MGETIVRSFEKDHAYLGEAAQIMVQNVNYEIPYQKKQVQKIQQQLAELETKGPSFYLPCCYFPAILEVVNGDSVSRAIEYYTNFVRDAHTEEEKTSVSVLKDLRHLKENPPPSLHVSLSAEVQNSLESTAKPDLSSLETGGKPLDSNEPMDAID
uniref:Uncharacterized protein n=1 Tax=Ananas comosus var. bracteatus TaxID=296719 RepID=A0A6V7Q3E4_ANACO|nr:unnamed protein product [Ananas comosus var. bracteatus]